MNLSLHPEALALKENLAKQLKTLKANRDKVPLDILKSKYKAGYEELCKNIRNTAAEYVKQIALYDIRIHPDYLDESIMLVDQAVQKSGILKALSNAAFCKQDIAEFTVLAFQLQSIIQETLDSFYGKHTGLYITPECLENPDILPEFYCFANGCIWNKDSWIPFEQAHPVPVPKSNIQNNPIQ